MRNTDPLYRSLVVFVCVFALPSCAGAVDDPAATDGGVAHDDAFLAPSDAAPRIPFDGAAPAPIGSVLAKPIVVDTRASGNAMDNVLVSFGQVFAIGDVTVDLATRRVQRGGEDVRLTRTEYRVLALLVRAYFWYRDRY